MTFKQLDIREQSLLTLMRTVCYGRLENIDITAGHAELTPSSRKIVTVNFDHDDALYAPSREDGDFLLTEKHQRFLRRIRNIPKGRIQSITVTAGLPVRADIEEAITSF